MPEIALGAVSALDAPPGLIKPARKGGAARGGRKAGPRLRKFRAHAALVVGSSAFSALMIGIVLNATVMQKEHHPAPLFGSAPPARAVAQPAPPPVPAVAAPVPVAAPMPAIAELAPPAVVPAKPRPVAATPAPAAGRDKSAAAPHRPAKGGSDAIAHLLGRPAVAAHKPALTAAKPAVVDATAKSAPVQPVHSRPLPPAR